jgi:hypothetical protein
VAKNKEVATGGMKKSREESFGGAPGSVAVAGGKYHKFGHTVHDSVWPPAPVSVDSKTGYPKGFQNEKGKIKP